MPTKIVAATLAKRANTPDSFHENISRGAPKKCVRNKTNRKVTTIVNNNARGNVLGGDKRPIALQ
jgi:hypothetical protein